MAINLTSGLFSKLSKLVLQVFECVSTEWEINGETKKSYLFKLSDGAFLLIAYGTELYQLVRSQQLHKGSIIQLNRFLSFMVNGHHFILVKELHVIVDKCNIIGDPKPLPRELSVNETASLERNKPPMHSGMSNTEQGHADPDGFIFGSRESMAVKLTSGAISKLSKLVLQVFDVQLIESKIGGETKQKYLLKLSEGAFLVNGVLCSELSELVTSLQLQKGSIVELREFESLMINGYNFILVKELHVIVDKCNIIGDPKRFPHKLSVNETPSLERNKPPMHSGMSNMEQGHADPDLNNIVDDSNLAQKGASHSHSQAKSKTRKRQSSNHKILAVAKDISKIARMIMEKNREGDIGACIEKLDKLGWGTQDPMYDTALLLFGESAEYRKLWLHLKPESCGKWVKNAGVMFGLLE